MRRAGVWGRPVAEGLDAGPERSAVPVPDGP